MIKQPIIKKIIFLDSEIKVKKISFLARQDKDLRVSYLDLENRTFFFDIVETEVFYDWDQVKINAKAGEIHFCELMSNYD